MDQSRQKSSLVEVCATNGVEMRAFLVSPCNVPQNSSSYIFLVQEGVRFHVQRPTGHKKWRHFQTV